MTMLKKSVFKSTLLLVLFLFAFNFSSAQTEVIAIDFGSSGMTETPSPWNNITNPVSGLVYNLVNLNAAATGIGIAVTDDFSGSASSGGTTTVSPTLNYPSTATSDYFYGSSTNSTGALLLSNLVVGKEYTLKIFGSRSISDSDVRQATCTVVGLTIQSGSYDATNNVSTVTSFTFKPKTDGTAVITLAKGTENTNSSGFFYLNAMQLSYSTETPSYSSNALLVDFGSSTNTSSSNWNNLSNALLGGSLSNLTNNGGVATNVNLVVTDAFNFVNTEGTVGAGSSLGIPSTATSDSFFGNTVDYLGKTEPSGAVKFSNLDPNVDLALKFYASRVVYTDKDNRDSKYTIEGLTTKVVSLNAANNTNNFVSTQVKPKADGSLTVTVSKGDNNTNVNGFFYLGAMIMDFVPAAPSLTISSPNGGEFWQTGKTTEISWNSSSLSSTIDLEYSIDNGLNWNLISSVSSTTKSYLWTVPNTVSTNCLVRVTAGSAQDNSDGVFEISSDTTTCTVVVLGSSTAEGTGASSMSASWVGLFSKAIYQKNTRLSVVNLGKGGYTTYHIMPTGYTAPQGVNVAVDVNRNITKALSYNPIAIIVNMPSNDTANGYSVADQLSNFNTLNNTASGSAVPMWITTTQPRNFSEATKIQDQIAVRDGILSTFGAKAIDFWTDIAAANGTILSTLNYGDGVHLNDAGHSLLYNRVLATGIGALQCTSGSTLGTTLFVNDSFSIHTFPNPVKDHFTVSFNAVDTGKFDIQLFDVSGKVIFHQTASFSSGTNSVAFALPTLNKQIVMGKIQFKKDSGEVVRKEFKLIIE